MAPVFGLVPTTANAQIGFGAGLTSLPCSEIIAFADDEEKMGWVHFWVKGLWTGLNVASAANGNPTKNLTAPTNRVKALNTRIVAFCYENNDMLLLDVGLSFYNDLPDHETQD